MTVYAFVDLDDTLFNSERKAAPGGRVAAVGRDGAPLSYQSARQEAFLREVLGRAVVVPTTGRNEAALRRVVLPLPGWAVCSFGGLILTPEGTPEPRWHAMVAAESERARSDIEAIVRGALIIAGEAGMDVRASVVCDAGLPLYASVKHNAHDEAELAYVAEGVRAMLPFGWSLHLNGNNLAAMPGFLGKEKAVRWLLDNVATDATLTLGVGDSLTDVGFMGLCDFAIAPTAHSQIFDAILRV